MNKIGRALKFLLTTKYAWVTNGVIGAGLFSAGDILEQAIEVRYQNIHRYDFTRTGRMALVGFTQGPGKQILFWGLERFFPGRSASAVWKKVVVDQLVSCPLFYFQFFMGMGMMEGKTAKESWEEFLRKFPAVYLVDLVLWTPCQIINFRFVPVSHRVLFVNVLTVIWNVFLSYVKHYDQHEDPRIEECCRRGTCDCHQNFILLSFILRLMAIGPEEATKTKKTQTDNEVEHLHKLKHP